MRNKLYGGDIPSSTITPEALFRAGRPAWLGSRRAFLGTASAFAATAALAPGLAFANDKLTTVPGKYTTNEQQTPFNKATTYNNFYEYGVEKDQPAKNAHTLHTRPWTIQVAGMVKKPLTVNIDDLIHYRPLESRVYRHRCVEAWSMVIPWDGYSLSEFIKFCQPLPSAKYVQFLSLYDPKQMPLLSESNFESAYSEGLRMDEAMHPLTMITFGCYGQVLPNQNGAPVRINVPWKWGYKSAKSIVKINFTDKQPRTTWNDLNSEEYGFYSNVNPNISHRWSQAHERRLDAGFPHSVETQMFNGYGSEVASLYNGMDLNKYY